MAGADSSWHGADLFFDTAAFLVDGAASSPSFRRPFASIHKSVQVKHIFNFRKCLPFLLVFRSFDFADRSRLDGADSSPSFSLRRRFASEITMEISGQ
jgi:hypothetical protein